MKPDQTLEIIALADLVEKARVVQAQGGRLVQICATALPSEFELTYSFDFGGRLASFRVQVPRDHPRVPSIGSVYACAFLYENEMHDLFNLSVEGMTVDFHGKLYNTAIKYAFGETKAPPAKPQPAAAAAQPN
jgi:ech hydrogenase subunit D